MFIKNLISFKETWLLRKSKYLCQKNYVTTPAQSFKLETNTNKVKNRNRLENLCEGYLKHGESFLMLFVASYCGFHSPPLLSPPLIPPNVCVSF